jgi:hypothetical protein
VKQRRTLKKGSTSPPLADLGRLFQGHRLARRGDTDAGLTLLRRESDRAGDARLLPRFLFPLGELAACLGEPNEIEKGLATVDAALERCMGELL